MTPERSSSRLTPAQCREARLLLGWTQAQLGRALGLHGSVIDAFEQGARLLSVLAMPPGWSEEIREVLTDAGVEFIQGTDSAPGVRLRAERAMEPQRENTSRGRVQQRAFRTV